MSSTISMINSNNRDAEIEKTLLGLDFFNDLDKHMYSDSMEIIEPFKDGDYEIDTVYAIGNDRQMR